MELDRIQFEVIRLQPFAQSELQFTALSKLVPDKMIGISSEWFGKIYSSREQHEIFAFYLLKLLKLLSSNRTSYSILTTFSHKRCCHHIGYLIILHTGECHKGPWWLRDTLEQRKVLPFVQGSLMIAGGITTLIKEQQWPCLVVALMCQYQIICCHNNQRNARKASQIVTIINLRLNEHEICNKP